MDFDLPAHLGPLIALYPEIHYRFRAFPFSLYYRRQPEIIADAPYRLEPGSGLPVLLLVKDADRFPVLIDSVKIDAFAPDRRVTQVLSLRRETIKQHWWHHIEWLDLPDESPCTWQIVVTWQVEVGRREYIFKTSNLPRLANSPLLVQQSGYPLPRGEGWVYGDLHVHTAYTEDQVEFGAPLAAYPALGQASGLSFIMAADHGYDLDDLPEADREFLFRRVNKRVWSDKQRKAYFSTLRNLGPWVRDCQTNLPEQLKGLTIPTLIIRGDFDDLFSEENARSVARVQPNTTYCSIHDAGHLPHQERPAEFLIALQDWLETTID